MCKEYLLHWVSITVCTPQSRYNRGCLSPILKWIFNSWPYEQYRKKMADYEQFLRAFFSCFHGQFFFLNIVDSNPECKSKRPRRRICSISFVVPSVPLCSKRVSQVVKSQAEATQISQFFAAQGQVEICVYKWRYVCISGDNKKVNMPC